MNNKSISAFLAVIAIFVITLISVSGFFKVVDFLKDNNIASAPVVERPIFIEEDQEIYNPKVVELLTESYTPSQNVYINSTVYDEEALKLVVNGQFESLIVHASGEVVNKGIHFLSVNFGTESGILYGVRSSANNLDIEATRLKGGIFTEDTGFDVRIDLLDETPMATNKDEYQKSQQMTKLVRLWDYMLLDPPTVTRLLLAPFNKHGVYGGIQINSIKIEYICKNGGDACKVALCSSEDKTTKCLLDNAGEWAMDNWCMRSRVCP
jgi:hypothetical protein